MGAVGGEGRRDSPHKAAGRHQEGAGGESVLPAFSWYGTSAVTANRDPGDGVTRGQGGLQLLRVCRRLRFDHHPSHHGGKWKERSEASLEARALCPSVSLGNSPGSFSWQCPLHTPQDQNPPKALAGPRGEPPLPLGLCFLLREVEPQKHGCRLGSRVVTVSVGLLVGQTTYLPCPGHGSAHAGPLVPEPGCRLAANVVLPAAFIQGRSHYQACRR